MKSPSLRQQARVESEAGLQDACVEALERSGYRVLQVGRWTRQTQCPHCRAWHTPRGGYGNTPGTPDLLVGHARWGAVLLPIEMKAPGARTLLGTIAPGRLRREQAALHAEGVIAVAYSLDDVWAAVARMDAKSGAEPLAEASGLELHRYANTQMSKESPCE